LELDAKSDRVQDALAFARRNLHQPLSVEQLAEAARLGPRQFSRVFRVETGQSPAKAIENLRLEAARLALEQGRRPIEAIATETGFGDRERMRRAFLRAFGQTPQAIRNASHRSLPSDPESLQSVPNDQAERLGAGTVNLPFEHRIAQRKTVGERQPAPPFSCCPRIWTLNRVSDFRR
jgi:AraC-like DNA-binding protein